jgi:hypothetical protein
VSRKPGNIGALVPGGLAKAAAINAGLTPDTGINTLLRIAVAMFKTGDLDEAFRYTTRNQHKKTVGSLPRDNDLMLWGNIPDPELSLRDVPNRAAAIRTGLAMMAGWSKEDAEAARFVRPRGYQHKDQET